MTDLIVVRDRRQPKQFSIHNHLIDLWLPIITPIGLALYALYTRMANRVDERSWPGYQLITSHIGMGRTTISNYNKILEWCSLLHIEHGNHRRSNEYYILDIPDITAERLLIIRKRALAEWKPGSTALLSLLRRLDLWEPIQAHWSKAAKRPTVVRPDQLPLPSLSNSGSTLQDYPSPPREHPSPVGEHPSPVGEHPSPPREHPSPPRVLEQSETTIRNNNPKEHTTATTPDPAVVDLLAQYKIDEPCRSKLAETCDYALARAWCLYASTQQLDNPPGFIVDKLRSRHRPPPDFLVLAGIQPDNWTWLHENARTRHWTGDWPPNLPLANDLAELWYTLLIKESPQ